jgi:hypothetical protein
MTGGPRLLVHAVLFAAEFAAGFRVMGLDLLTGAMWGRPPCSRRATRSC